MHKISSESFSSICMRLNLNKDRLKYDTFKCIDLIPYWLSLSRLLKVQSNKFNAYMLLLKDFEITRSLLS